MVEVLDISKYNIVKDYSAVAASVDGIIIRCGYRSLSNGKLIKDPLFDTHIKNLSNTGANIGVYFFTTAITETEGAQEAAFVYELIKNYKISFPVFIDSEYSNKNKTGRSDKLSQEDRTKAILGFCKKIEKLGYTAGIYASDSWFVNNLNYNTIKGYKLWVASYSGSPKRVKDYTAWQYTSSGSVKGINARVDLSHWYESIGDMHQAKQVVTKSNPYIEPSITIRYGNKGEYVYWLQYELIEEGYNLELDGSFGRITDTAVRNYQLNHGLEVDGVVGSITRRSLRENYPAINQKPKIDNGVKVSLVSVPLYSSSNASKATRTITGDYYIWSTIVKNNKIRITTDSSYSNNLKYITGWIDYNSIKDQFR